jgi:hypothetical protein
MSWGVALRNAVSLGLGGIISLATGEATPNPGPPWEVLNASGTLFVCDTLVKNSSGTDFVTVDSVKDSAGTTYLPV